VLVAGWHEIVWHLARTLATYHHRRDHADVDIRTWGLALRASDDRNVTGGWEVHGNYQRVIRTHVLRSDKDSA
jgi:hypothetical protein